FIRSSAGIFLSEQTACLLSASPNQPTGLVPAVLFTLLSPSCFRLPANIVYRLWRYVRKVRILSNSAFYKEELNQISSKCDSSHSEQSP
ncbi:hypothetical protein V2W45_1238848, partial [Cenococcum geophilum]